MALQYFNGTFVYVHDLMCLCFLLAPGCLDDTRSKHLMYISTFSGGQNSINWQAAG